MKDKPSENKPNLANSYFKKAKDVKLTITSRHKTEQEQHTESRLYTEAKLFVQGKKFMLRYKNVPAEDLTEQGNESEIILWNPRTVILKSKGSIQYTFHLIKNKITHSDFFTDNLFVSLTLHAIDISYHITSRHGRIHLVYRMGDDCAVLSENQVDISICPCCHSKTLF